MQKSHRGPVVLASVTFVAFLWAFIEALDFPTSAGYFPLGVTGAGLLASAAFVVQGLTKSRKFRPVGVSASGDAIPEVTDAEEAANDAAPAAPGDSNQMEWREALGWILWASAYVALLWLLGMIVATLVFLVVSLRWFGRPPWWGYVVAGGLMVLLWYASAIFALEWPQGLLIIF